MKQAIVWKLLIGLVRAYEDMLVEGGYHHVVLTDIELSTLTLLDLEHLTSKYQALLRSQPQN